MTPVGDTPMSTTPVRFIASFQNPCAHCVAHGPEFWSGCPTTRDERMTKCPTASCDCLGLIEQGGLCEFCYFETK